MSKEVFYYAENAVGRVHIADRMSQLAPGYALRSTSNSKEMERVWARLNQQERDANEKRIEQLYSRGWENYDRMRGELLRRLGLGSTSNFEKSIIRESLKLMDEKQHAAEQNHVYGVAAMEEAPAPLPAPRTRIM